MGDTVILDDTAATSSSFRRSVGTGALAKAIGFINQIASVPLLAATLGATGLASFYFAISLASWFGIFLFGAQVSLPRQLIAAHGDVAEQRRIIAGATVLYAGCGLLCLAGSLLCFVVMKSFSPQIANAGSAVVAAALMNALYLATAMSEHILTARQRNFVFYVASLIGSIISLAATFACYYLRLGAPAFIVAFYLSMAAPSAAAYLRIVVIGAGLSIADFQSAGSRMRDLVRTGAAALAFQASLTARVHMAIFGVAAVASPGSVAIYGSAMRLLQMMFSGISILFNPVLAECAHALRAGNIARYAALRSRLLWAGTSLCLLCVVSLVIAGPTFFEVWVRGLVEVNRVTSFWIGSLLGVTLLEGVLFYLAAASPRYHRLAGIFILQAVVGLAAGLFLAARFGASGMLAAFVVTSVITIGALSRAGQPTAQRATS